MNNKEFVLKYCPTAKEETQKRGRVFSETYYLIRERGKTMYIASGDTKAKAWAAAAQLVAEKVVEKKYPKVELLKPETGTDFVVYEAISCTVLAKAATPVKAWRKAAEAIVNEPL